MRVADATVLVTGASGGIGSATAFRLHHLGARVILQGRDPGRLSAVAERLGAEAVVADLAEAGGATQVARMAGPVDVLVHCAGAGLRGGFADIAESEVQRILAVNLYAPILLTRELVPAMCAAGHGHLAFVGSIAGLTGVRLEAVYAAAKAGLLTFAESLRFELTGCGVTVSTISPAVVDTGFWQARGVPYHRRSPRPLPPDTVARLLVEDIVAGNADRIVPRWISAARAVHAIAPAAHRLLTTRFDRP